MELSLGAPHSTRSSTSHLYSGGGTMTTFNQPPFVRDGEFRGSFLGGDMGRGAILILDF